MTQHEILSMQGINCFHKAGLWQREFYNNTAILDLGEEIYAASQEDFLAAMVERGYDMNDHRSIAPILGLTSIEEREGDEDLFITSIYNGYHTALVFGDWFHNLISYDVSEWSRFTPELQKKLNFYLFRINHV